MLTRTDKSVWTAAACYSEIAELRCTEQTITFNFPFSHAETVEYFRTYCGPALRAFAALSTEAQRSLRSDLEQHWARHNCSQDDTTQVDSTYLEVVAVRK